MLNRHPRLGMIDLWGSNAPNRVVLQTGNPRNSTVTGIPLGSRPPQLNTGPPRLLAEPQTLGYYVWQHTDGNWYYVELASSAAGRERGIPLTTVRPSATRGDLPRLATENYHHIETQAAMLSAENNIQHAYVFINQSYVCRFCRPGSPVGHTIIQPGDILRIGQTLTVISEANPNMAPVVINGMRPAGR